MHIQNNDITPATSLNCLYYSVVYKRSCSQLMIFVSFSIKFIMLPCSYSAHFAPSNFLTPARSNLDLANLLATVISQPDLFRLLTFQVLNNISLFNFLGHTRVLFQVQGTCSSFITKPVFMVRSCQHLAHPPKLEDHPLLVVHNCLFNIFASTLNIGHHSFIRNQRTCHAVVTQAHLSWICTILVYIFPLISDFFII